MHNWSIKNVSSSTNNDAFDINFLSSSVIINFCLFMVTQTELWKPLCPEDSILNLSSNQNKYFYFLLTLLSNPLMYDWSSNRKKRTNISYVYYITFIVSIVLYCNAEKLNIHFFVQLLQSLNTSGWIYLWFCLLSGQFFSLMTHIAEKLTRWRWNCRFDSCTRAACACIQERPKGSRTDSSQTRRYKKNSQSVSCQNDYN